MQQAQALDALVKSQTELQRAVQELVKRFAEDRAQTETRAPSEVLTKLSPNDDVEAYLNLFERTAARERWPVLDWGSILASFLTGDAQRVCHDLSVADARDFNKLKTAILASQGLSLPARAQRYHSWAFHSSLPPRPQLAALMRVTNSWLMSPGDPPLVERIVIDKCIRSLPPDARKYASQVSPTTVDALVALLENHQVSNEMLRFTKVEVPKTQVESRPQRERTRPPTPSPTTPASRPAPVERPSARTPRRCYVCGKPDHLSWTCPDRGKDVSMPSAAEAGPACFHTGTRRRRQGFVPVRVNGTDSQALLDSGSLVTLVHADLAGPLTQEEMPVTCVHGDMRYYPVTHLRVQTTRGAVTVNAGVVPTLPVPLLIGTDCELYNRFWYEGGCRAPVARPRRRRARNPPEPLHACPAFRPSTDEPRSASSPEEGRREAEEPAAEGRLGESSEDAFSQFPDALPSDAPRRGEFATQQWSDPNLEMARQQVAVVDGERSGAVSELSTPYFIVKKGLIYRVTKNRLGELVDQLLVPKTFVSKVIYLAHSHQLGAHLGVDKTYERIVARFYWPGVRRAVADFCRGCEICQKTAPRPAQRNPLIPLPIIDVPFSRIAMDIVGPLPKSSRGHRYMLVIVDYATRYPEAIPLRAASAKAIAHELFMLFSRVGICDTILTDQGSNFMSRVLKLLYKWLNVKRIRTSVYHPQTDGLVERFNQTLKKMLKKLVDVDGRDWDQLIPYVLFSIREVPQASTGFSPFELLYGRQPRGLLDLAKEAWERQPCPQRSVVEHIERLQARARKVWPLVREHMEKAQRDQSRVYNRGAVVREFQVGEKVLVLVPSNECKFLARWQGPYEVIEKVGPVNYKVRQPGRQKGQQIYHVNILKKWHPSEPVVLPALLTSVSPHTLPPVPVGEDLSPEQHQDVKQLLTRNQDRFSEVPGRTDVIQHDIYTVPGKVVRQRPYRIPQARREGIKKEVENMLQLKVIEESNSPWSSPIVMVPKPDGTMRFCNDFRKLNEISRFDAYPMPRVDELIERLGPARFVSTLDLTKGYWQVPLTYRAKAKTAFATPEGLFQYTVLPFGVHGAPATFQRMMDRILRPHREYAAAYLDDIVVHSTSWEAHIQHLDAVLGALRKANLTANAKKCRIGLSETEYLGFTIGRGCVKPQARKVERIREWPRPLTKKQLKSFLGLISYYLKFISHYATVAAPLYDLTRHSSPNQLKWDAAAEEAFQALKQALCEEPVLKAPDFTRPFLLHTDASQVGLGAVLSQVIDEEEHPVLYISRKLLKHEVNYATIEKEALAVKWAVHHLRYYLWGRDFTLITDHAPLKWMARNKDKNARITRWFLELQDYHFKVEHRPGKSIPHADALSRMYEAEMDEATAPGARLGRGVCGITEAKSPTGKPSAYRESSYESRVKNRRNRQSLGTVIGGRYIPNYLLDQPDLSTPARS